eukprot:jgi/Orpsp1_1/1186306/evm.model.d7180000049592.1
MVIKNSLSLLILLSSLTHVLVAKRCGLFFGKCPKGQCCSKHGYCGTTASYCSVSNGCKSLFGDCKCGDEFGSCPIGQCCNKEGFCGITSDYCSTSKGCNSKYGDCRCGKKFGKCPEGQCCSILGYCETSSVFCSIFNGCNPKFGECKVQHKPIQSEGTFSNITKFESPVEIHTPIQKEFLSYTGNYDKIDPNLYPNGDTNISDSLPVNVKWNYQPPKDKIVSIYSVTYGQKSDLSDGYTITTTSQSANIFNPYLGDNYFRITAQLSDNSKDESDIYSFKVDEAWPRNLALEGMTNSRDIGGRNLEDGGKIKQGLVFRTSGYKYDYESFPTENSITEMLQHLKFKTEINMADSLKYNFNLNGTTLINTFMDYGGSSSHHLSRNKESLKNFFNILGDSSNYPIFFHCRIGTDRTGVGAILLNGLLGVSINDIYQDYLFSNFGFIQDKRYIGIRAGEDDIQGYMYEMSNLAGKTFKNKVYNFLLTIGVPSSTLDTIISNLTEGQVATGNDAGQIVATADKLTGHGVTVTKDTSERDHPDYYFQLNSTSHSVSYSFTSSKDYKGQVVAYLGNEDHTFNKMISDAISCKLDSTSITIKNQTYADAGLGNCNDRMNYYFVILGEIDISAGNHTITITGSDNVMNIGTLCIFDTEGSSDPIDITRPTFDENHVHYYTRLVSFKNKIKKRITYYICECGSKYIIIDFFDGYSSLSGSLNDGTMGKLSKGTIVKYDIPVKSSKNVELQFAIKIPNDSYKTQKFDTSNYTIKLNGSTKSLSIKNGATYEDIGLSTGFTYITFCTFDIDNDTNIEIELESNNDILIFGEQVKLFYDA